MFAAKSVTFYDENDDYDGVVIMAEPNAERQRLRARDKAFEVATVAGRLLHDGQTPWPVVYEWNGRQFHYYWNKQTSDRPWFNAYETEQWTER